MRAAARARRALQCAIAAVLVAPGAAGQTQIEGELKGVTIDDRGDPASGGTLIVGDRRIVVPPRLLIELPGATLTLSGLFARAPVRCRIAGLAGLLAHDACLRPPREAAASRVWSAADDTTPRSTLDPAPTDDPPTTKARVQVTMPTGDPTAEPRSRDPIATRIVLLRDDQSVNGAVTFINEDQGYLRVGGAFGVDAGGTLVRINDPDGNQSAQSGIGCGGEGNCSPDARFRADPEHYTVRFDAGYPACIPGGLGDVCAASSRPVRGIVDAARLIPIRVGDHVTALGAFEVIDGVRIFSAQTLVDHTSPLAVPEN
jgi:hypothetical protein